MWILTSPLPSDVASFATELFLELIAAVVSNDVTLINKKR